MSATLVAIVVVFLLSLGVSIWWESWKALVIPSIGGVIWTIWIFMSDTYRVLSFNGLVFIGLVMLVGVIATVIGILTVEAKRTTPVTEDDDPASLVSGSRRNIYARGMIIGKRGSGM